MKMVPLWLYHNEVNRTDLPIDAMIKFEARAAMGLSDHVRCTIDIWSNVVCARNTTFRKDFAPWRAEAADVVSSLALVMLYPTPRTVHHLNVCTHTLPF